MKSLEKNSQESENFQGEIDGKKVCFTAEEMKSTEIIVQKINNNGGNVGTGHDFVELTKNDDVFSMSLSSYCGGPTWSFTFYKIT